jgi:hypothetical protein
MITEDSESLYILYDYMEYQGALFAIPCIKRVGKRTYRLIIMKNEEGFTSNYRMIVKKGYGTSLFTSRYGNLKDALFDAFSWNGYSKKKMPKLKNQLGYNFGEHYALSIDSIDDSIGTDFPYQINVSNDKYLFSIEVYDRNLILTYRKNGTGRSIFEYQCNNLADIMDNVPAIFEELESLDVIDKKTDGRIRKLKSRIPKGDFFLYTNKSSQYCVIKTQGVNRDNFATVGKNNNK